MSARKDSQPTLEANHSSTPARVETRRALIEGLAMLAWVLVTLALIVAISTGF